MACVCVVTAPGGMHLAADMHLISLVNLSTQLQHLHLDALQCSS